LEGLRIALANLDDIIKIIKRSSDADIAKERLILKYKLSPIQAQAILDMPLRRLAALERKKIEDEFKQLTIDIKGFEAILKSAKRLRQLVETELLAVKEKYADRRKSHIVSLKKVKKLLKIEPTTDLTSSRIYGLELQKKAKWRDYYPRSSIRRY